MVEIPIEEYIRYLEELKTIGRQLEYATTCMILAMLVLCITLIPIIKSLPEKETRKRIKALAKEKRIKEHAVINEILKKHFEQEDKRLANSIYAETNRQPYEEWKEARLKKNQKNQHPEE